MPSLRLVLVGSMGDSGDSVYRLHQPAAALAALPDTKVVEVDPAARHRDAAVLAWNPAHASWSDPRALRCFEQLIRRADATQVTSAALGHRPPPAPQSRCGSAGEAPAAI